MTRVKGLSETLQWIQNTFHLFTLCTGCQKLFSEYKTHSISLLCVLDVRNCSVNTKHISSLYPVYRMSETVQWIQNTFHLFTLCTGCRKLFSECKTRFISLLCTGCQKLQWIQNTFHLFTLCTRCQKLFSVYKTHFISLLCVPDVRNCSVNTKHISSLYSVYLWPRTLSKQSTSHMRSNMYDIATNPIRILTNHTQKWNTWMIVNILYNCYCVFYLFFVTAVCVCVHLEGTSCSLNWP
jgi:hypothetical protein